MESLTTKLSPVQRGPAAEILRLLRQHGPQSVKTLRATLGVSTNAVREQLQRLIDAELVTIGKLRQGAGRPAHVYALSDKAQELFPQPYDALLKVLLDTLVAEDGPTGTQRLLNMIGERLADDVTGGVQCDDLRAQIDAVTAAMDERGMPIVLVDEDDDLALHEWCCPYYSVARDHAGICEMEQHMLARALGTRVTLVERRLDGHIRCKFVVERPSRAQNPDERYKQS